MPAPAPRIPDFAAWAQGGVATLRAYDPGHDIVALRRAAGPHGLLELGSNENAWGASGGACRAAAEALREAHRYPDPLGGDLRRALARVHGLTPAHVLLGNGSHELLMLLAQAFAGPEAGVVASEFGFAVYAIAARAAGAPFRVAPAFGIDAPMPRGHDLAAFGACVDATSRVVYLANPNNPTGTWFGLAELERLLEAVGPERLVIVDEAYMEYATEASLQSAIPLLARHPNLVVTRTFSKAHGLAGLRVGFACAHPDLLAVLERLRESFNVNAPGLAAAEAALDDAEHVRRVREQTAQGRAALAAALCARGIRVGPSQTNFLLADFGRDAGDIEARLLSRDVVPRPMRGYGLPQCLRLTVGTPADNGRLLDALDAALHGEGR